MLLGYSNLRERFAVQISTLSNLNNLLTIAVSSLALAVPLGFLIHESDVFLYRRVYRSLRGDYAWTKVIRRCFRDGATTEAEKVVGKEHYQALLEFVKYTDGPQADTHLEEEVGNRWSYFYPSLEAGLFAPIFAVLLCLATAFLVGLQSEGMTLPRASVGAAFIVFSSILLLGYCPRLMKETDAIETLRVLEKEQTIRALISSARWVEPEEDP